LKDEAAEENTGLSGEPLRLVWLEIAGRSSIVSEREEEYLWTAKSSGRICYALLRTGVDNHALILLMDHERNKRLLNVEDSEEVHVKNGFPVVYTIPGSSLQTNPSVIHKNRDLA
jgi:hypothetical protein